MHSKNHDIVVLAGSGRSGTTWLGSIMDTYSRSEYFYEIDAFPGLDFDSPDLLHSKYPLTYWLPVRSARLVQIEQKILLECKRRNIFREKAGKALRIRNRIRVKNCSNPVFFFKIVKLYRYALRYRELVRKFGASFKTVHILRNPYAQLVSQMRVDMKHAENAAHHFSRSVQDILSHPQLERYHDHANKYLNASWIEQMALMWWVSNELMIDVSDAGVTKVVFENVARRPLEEMNRVFDALEWEMSDQSRAFIMKTTKATANQNGNFSIHRNADEVQQKWKKEISEKEYELVRLLLENCELMRHWSPEDLQL